MTNITLYESPSFALDPNFNVNQLCEEILRNTRYNFNVPVDVLIKNSTTSRLAVRNEKKKLNKIPRRQNAWIIYRRDKCASPEFKGKGLKSAEMSKKIAELWAKEPKEIVALFDILAKRSEEIHKNKYVDYEYKPQKKEKQRKSKKNKVPKNEEPAMSSSPEPEEPSRFPPTPISSPDFPDETNFISMNELERPEPQLLSTLTIPTQEPLSPNISETYDEPNIEKLEQQFLIMSTPITSPREPPLPVDNAITNVSTHEPEESEQRALPDMNIFIPALSPPVGVVDNIIFEIEKHKCFSEEQSEDFLQPIQQQPQQQQQQQQHQQQQQQHQQQQQQHQQQPQDWMLYEESSISRSYFSLGV